MKPSRQTCDSRPTVSSAGKRNVLGERSIQGPRQVVRVFDEEDKDRTPKPLLQLDPRSKTTAINFQLDESFDDPIAATGSSTGSLFSSQLGGSNQSIAECLKDMMEETFLNRDMPISFSDEKKPKETVKTEVTEDMLKQTVKIVVTETDTLSLLDIPPSRVSEDADDAKAIIERNNQYAEVCMKQTENNSLNKSVQTFNGLTKNKNIQCSICVMVDAATTVFNLDSPEQEETLNPVETPETKKTDLSVAVMDSGRSAERSLSLVSSVTTVTVSSSLKGVEASGSSSDAQPDLQLLMMSEKFQHSVFVMERALQRNSFQPQLSTCRQLPLQKDPDGLFHQEAEEDEEEEASLSPALKCLWVFSSELSRGCGVSCMAWNKENLDLLAVGYGDFDFSNKKPGLVLCWSLKNPLWPERLIHCGSAVTCLDFSVSSPAQLAVGMQDGSIVIYDVQSPHIETHIFSSNESSNKHIGPVWQLKWNFTGEAKSESLFSVGEDGRFRKWSVFNGVLDCEDLLKLNKTYKIQKKVGKKTETSEILLAAPGWSFDFHPRDPNIYLIATLEGPIHKGACTNNQQVLATYKKHFSLVNSVSWCPLNPDVFLSCSSDWTIQLWNQDCLEPVLGFSSTQTPVNDIKWSPKWASVFGALTDDHIEIWDLNSSSLVPVIVQPAAPGVKMTSLLFASHTNCIVVGDTCGQVTIYQLKNLGGRGI